MSLARVTAAPAADLGHLLRLRWSMLTRWARLLLSVGLLFAAAVLPLTMALGVRLSPRMSAENRLQVMELLPAAFLVTAIGILVAAVASSGGRELLPRAQLQAYPVSPVSEHLGILLLTPANLAWWLQVLGLVLLTGTATEAELTDITLLWPASLLTFGVCLAWILAVTTLAQVLAWVVELIRVQRGGPWVLRVALVLIVIVGARSANATTLTKLLGWGPSTSLVETAMQATDAVYLPGLLLILALLVAAAAFTGVGAASYTWLTRMPTREQARSETRDYTPRRLLPVEAWASDLRVWRRQDWAMVWRCVPLRRGLLVIGVVPMVGGVLAQVGARDIALLTGVVCAGAGLIIGVNAMALDAEGAPFRENLPVEPRVWVLARAWVLAEMIGGTAVLTTGAALVNARGAITPTVVVTLLVAIPTMTLSVLARCLRWSVLQPSRAELRTSRDSPATPGRLMTYSARLIGATLLLGILLAVAARVGHPIAPLIVVVPSLVLNLLSIARTVRRFDDHGTRALLVQAVSRG